MLNQLILHSIKTTAVADCAKEQAKTFFGLPVWYKYLPLDPNANCAINVDFYHANNVWLILLGVIDILLRIAGIASVVFVMYGGFVYITSQGEPEHTKKAKEIIFGAIIGLMIVLLATQVVSFVANQL